MITLAEPYFCGGSRSEKTTKIFTAGSSFLSIILEPIKISNIIRVRYNPETYIKTCMHAYMHACMHACMSFVLSVFLEYLFVVRILLMTNQRTVLTARTMVNLRRTPTPVLPPCKLSHSVASPSSGPSSLPSSRHSPLSPLRRSTRTRSASTNGESIYYL